MRKWVSSSGKKAGTNILSIKNIFIQNYIVDVRVINLGQDKQTSEWEILI
jgi:hypothetical protein